MAPQRLTEKMPLGTLIAQEGWVLLTGGKNVGVMDAVSRGVKAAKGLTVGILSNTDDRGLSDAVDKLLCI